MFLWIQHHYKKRFLPTLVTFFGVVLIVSCPVMYALQAKTISFDSYKIQCADSRIEMFDYNGDGLDDIACASNDRIYFYLQGKSSGFSKKPDSEYAFKEPVVLAAPVLHTTGNRYDLLLMHHGGVRSIGYSETSTTPTITSLIERTTILPLENSSDYRFFFYPFVIHTVHKSPSVILPTSNAYEVWTRDENGVWSHETTLQSQPQHDLSVPGGFGVYIRNASFSMNVQDLTSDNRADLTIGSVNYAQEKVDFQVYAQTQDGHIPSVPTQTISTSFMYEEWNCIHDINGDGRVDLIKNTWLKEPWFIPGTYSGKVLVRIFLARDDFSIPDAPDYVFRKHDWMPRMPVVDIDGDGKTDLMLIYDRWRGREEVIKSLSSNKIDFNLRFHFYSDKGYSQSPDFQRDITIRTREASIFSVLFLASSLLDSSLINLDGDFNGDGLRDLLIRDRFDTLSIYFFKSRKDGFSSKPDIVFDVANVGDYIIRDFNRDGKSDLICKHFKQGEVTVFLSRMP